MLIFSPLNSAYSGSPIYCSKLPSIKYVVSPLFNGKNDCNCRVKVSFLNVPGVCQGKMVIFAISGQ
jgi:hypothetical protein